MQSHIDGLCFKYRINRRMVVREDAYELSEARPDIRFVVVPHISDTLTYWVTLHEIGHVLDQWSIDAFSTMMEDWIAYRTKQWSDHPYCLRVEARAWLWAIKNSLIKLDIAGYGVLRSSFKTYIKNCSFQDDHPDVMKIREITGL